MVLEASHTDRHGGVLIDVATASQLLDFGARMGQGPRAQEQLEGAVAIHNILEKHRVAYLADEVGMGKTYVALGALALFRHFQPDFRVVVIAPKENIQNKWIKEFGNFVAYNVRFPDLRVAAIDRRPARELVGCNNLIEFVHEALIDARRDFFLRLSSFSLALGDDVERLGWRRVRDGLRHEVPWLPEAALDLRSNKDLFKDNFARAVCCALPVFDLVIVDEGHNLKHGLKSGAAARNRVLALAFGNSFVSESEHHFRGYGPRAKRVLFLSATPLEETYQQVWNQLDVLGLGKDFEGLRDDKLSDDDKKSVAAKFLVRRVTTMRIGAEDFTKNQYRREWRRGGVHEHDEPICLDDDRQRLIVALVQKKVAELLGSEKFNMSFQIGMLASFESFLETTGLKVTDDERKANFDDPNQTDDVRDEGLRLVAREGIDVRDVNRLTRDYRHAFGKEMPHPKMDALVDSLETAWRTGKKALVFVRRVKSVEELKRKLDEKYDEWLIQTLRERLPQSVAVRFDEVLKKYSQEKREAETSRQAHATVAQRSDTGENDSDTDDRGGTDTFFAWFFRGEGPKSVVSGANVQRRFTQKGTVYSTFFEDNYVMDLLEVRPGGVVDALGRILGLESSQLRHELRHRAAKYIGRAKRLQRADRMQAAQAAALELLKERQDVLGERARIIWHERFETSRRKSAVGEAPEVSEGLEHATFFTELRRADRSELRKVLWPESPPGPERVRFREQQQRAQLLETAARLGHSLIDMYVLTIQRLRSLEQRTLEAESDEGGVLERRRIDEYLDVLERQRITPLGERTWGAFDELAQIARNFDLILDVNADEARLLPFAETARYFGSILRQQQPVGGMSGKVNKTLVQQFRMPGYPFILVTTDLLQEGEDLHTFCSAVYHYGIAWTPSSMEQRIGRIDRVRSESDRRLSGLEVVPDGADLLQVYYPHLEDTVEILQVQRVLERMNTFLRLMHEGLFVPRGDHRRVDVNHELNVSRRTVEAIRGRLRSAFPIPSWALEGKRQALATDAGTVGAVLERFERLSAVNYPGLAIEWEQSSRNGTLLGTVMLATGRIQPLALLLKSDGERLVVRCVSPLGRVEPESTMAAVRESAHTRQVRIGVILRKEDALYDLTVENDVLLGNPSHDVPRVAALLSRVVEQSDILEQIHLPLLDEPTVAFESDLKQEGGASRA
jgi:Type III restriction enzyme, res subunit/Helicase conserved C-terminal domain